MFTLICINMILCIYMAGLLGYYSYRNRPELYYWRTALSRIVVFTRSTTSKWIFYSVYAQDFVALVIGMVGWPLSKEAIDCDEGYEMFYFMTLAY